MLYTVFNLLFSSGSSDQQQSGLFGSPVAMIVLLVVMFGAMYFLTIRPQKKRQQEEQKLRDSVQIGDDITTIGGIVGTIVELDDDFVTFETGEDRVRIKISKWGISTNSAVTAEQAKKQA